MRLLDERERRRRDALDRHAEAARRGSSALRGRTSSRSSAKRKGSPTSSSSARRPGPTGASGSGPREASSAAAPGRAGSSPPTSSAPRSARTSGGSRSTTPGASGSRVGAPKGASPSAFPTRRWRVFDRLPDGTRIGLAQAVARRRAGGVWASFGTRIAACDGETIVPLPDPPAAMSNPYVNKLFEDAQGPALGGERQRRGAAGGGRALVAPDGEAREPLRLLPRGGPGRDRVGRDDARRLPVRRRRRGGALHPGRRPRRLGDEHQRLPQRPRRRRLDRDRRGALAVRPVGAPPERAPATRRRRVGRAPRPDGRLSAFARALVGRAVALVPRGGPLVPLPRPDRLPRPARGPREGVAPDPPGTRAALHEPPRGRAPPPRPGDQRVGTLGRRRLDPDPGPPSVLDDDAVPRRGPPRPPRRRGGDAPLADPSPEAAQPRAGARRRGADERPRDGQRPAPERPGGDRAPPRVEPGPLGERLALVPGARRRRRERHRRGADRHLGSAGRRGRPAVGRRLRAPLDRGAPGGSARAGREPPRRTRGRRSCRSPG